jgi:hypothetical protein
VVDPLVRMATHCQPMLHKAAQHHRVQRGCSCCCCRGAVTGMRVEAMLAWVLWGWAVARCCLSLVMTVTLLGHSTAEEQPSPTAAGRRSGQTAASHPRSTSCHRRQNHHFHQSRRCRRHHHHQNHQTHHLRHCRHCRRHRHRRWVSREGLVGPTWTRGCLPALRPL